MQPSSVLLCFISSFQSRVCSVTPPYTGLPGVGSQWWPEETNPAAQLVIGELGEEKSSRPPLPVIFVIRKERDILLIILLISLSTIQQRLVVK